MPEDRQGDRSGTTSDDLLLSCLDAVADLRSFVQFVDTLRKDREDADFKRAGDWRNNSIATFLESAVAWFEDNRRGTAAFLEGENAWRVAAKILYAGKHYE